MTILNSESSVEDQQAFVQAKEEKHREVKDGINEIMKTRSGRRYILKILRDCHLFSTTFTGNSRTFFNEGKRSIALSIHKDIQIYCEKEYRLMINEAEMKGDKIW